MQNNVNLGPVRPYLAATAIVKGQLCKHTANANELTPVTAKADACLYVAEDDVASGKWGNFRAFSVSQEQRVLITASVTKGAKLMVDVANPGKLITRDSGIGVAVAEEGGAANDLIKVAPCFTET